MEGEAARFRLGGHRLPEARRLLHCLRHRPDGVLAKLASAKVPYYTEPAQGNLTRVRAGPFASREAADQAVARLKELGFKPGAVTAKSG